MNKKVLKFTISSLLIVGIGATTFFYGLGEKQGIVSAATDKYANFKELQKNEEKNISYKTMDKMNDTNTAILAIHGGGIEVGTSEVVETLAKKVGYSSYIFESLKTKDNRDLHVTSTHFDDPAARKMAKQSNTTLSIHGYSGDEEVVYVGGLDKELKSKIIKQLKKDGFKAVEAPKVIAGTKPTNIVNDNKKKAGVQLELTTGLRKSFFKNGNWSKGNRANTTKQLDKFVNSLYKTIENHKN